VSGVAASLLIGLVFSAVIPRFLGRVGDRFDVDLVRPEPETGGDGGIPLTGFGLDEELDVIPASI